MAPPKKKRQRLVKDNKMDIEDDDNKMAWSTTATIKEQLSCKEQLMKTLMDQLNNLETGVDNEENSTTSAKDVSMSLLRLKSFQRKVLETLRRNQSILDQQSEIRDKQELRLENLRYQQSLNEESQRQSGAEMGTAEIIRLVRRTSNLMDDQGSNTDVKSNKECEFATTATIKDYFEVGVDWTDPELRSMIISKLNQEVGTRKSLEKQLRRVQQDRTVKLELLATKQMLIKDLPKKLADMEKASLSLQNFCQKSSLSSSSVKMNVTQKLGTKRRNRLDLAKTLPKALYTIYHQLQSCLDVMVTANTGSEVKSTKDTSFSGIDSDSMPSIDVSSTSSTSANECVLFKIPIPAVSDGGSLNYRMKKNAIITFEYNAQLDLVVATCGSDYDMGLHVINELFPGDTGEWTGRTNLIVASSDEKNSTTTLNPGGNKKAYHWANYLSGIHVIPKEQTAAKMYCSARVITMALVRRVRAQATLSWIVHKLARQPQHFPMHAAIKSSLIDDDDDDVDEEESLSSIKLSQWTIQEGDQASSSEHIIIYEGVLTTVGRLDSLSKNLTVRAWINAARYPSIIPRWEILSSSSISARGKDSLEVFRNNQMPLYNESLARLEKHVNRDVDEMVLPSDQTTYDWVLAQQLKEIARGWKKMLLSNE